MDNDIEGIKIVSMDNEEKSEYDLNDSFKIIVPIDKLNVPKSFSMEANISVRSKPILYGATTVDGKQKKEPF